MQADSRSLSTILPGLLTPDLPGTGGICRATLDDFRVEEIPAYTPTGAGQHTLFEVEKRGIDTLRAKRILATALGVPPNRIASAGLKDARAVTRQWLSVEGVAPSRVLSVQVRGVRVLSADLHRNRLKIGHLRGNRFTIKVRGVVTGALGRARRIMGILAERGVPNGFGPQRFGARRNTHLLGRALVRGDWDGFFAQYLGLPAEADPDDMRAARSLYDEGDLDGALDVWPAYARDERAILAVLARGIAPARAFDRIPRSLRRLFGAAYQSYLFNRLVDARLGDLGRLVPGDLAMKHENGAYFAVEDADQEQPRGDRLDISPTGALYGCKMRLASGVPGEDERRLLAAQGLSLEDWRVGHGVRLTGGRRPIRVPMTDVGVSADDGIVLQFSLPAGAYATNVLREVIKGADEDLS